MSLDQIYTTIGFNQSTGIFTDEHSNNDPGTFSSTEIGTYATTLTITSDNSEVHMKRGNGEYLGFFTLSGWNSASTSTYNYTVRINGTTSSTKIITLSSSTPPPDIQPIVNTGGSWNGVHSWASPTTETINGSVEYHYKLSFDTNSRIAYRTIDKTWYDADISSQPTALSSDAFSTQSSALVNPQYVWIGDHQRQKQTSIFRLITPTMKPPFQIPHHQMVRMVI